MVGYFIFPAARSIIERPGYERSYYLLRTRTEALFYCFASAFVPISDENRDGGRAFSLNLPGKASSVSPVPARIALQEENARAPMRYCPCPHKKRATPGTCVTG